PPRRRFNVKKARWEHFYSSLQSRLLPNTFQDSASFDIDRRASQITSAIVDSAVESIPQKRKGITGKVACWTPELSQARDNMKSKDFILPLQSIKQNWSDYYLPSDT